MKLVKAIVRPGKIDGIKDALDRLHVSGMTVNRGAGARQAEGAHRDLSRQGVRRHPAAQDGSRGGRVRRAAGGHDPGDR
jgi:nitrogen regulatory protein PII